MPERAGQRSAFLTGVATGSIVIVAAAAAVVSLQGLLAYNTSSAAAPAIAHPTTTVSAGSLQATVSGEVSATADATWQVAGAATDNPRIFTRDGAQSGDSIGDGGTLLTLNERPTFLLRSSVPFYRAMKEGSQGRDIKALQEGLERLGYGLDLDRSGVFGNGTAKAVFYLYRDRGYQPVDTAGAPVDLAHASAAAVPLGEIFGAATTPLAPVSECGRNGEVAADQACELRSTDGVTVVSVPETDASRVKSGQTLTITTDDGTELTGTIAGPTGSAEGNDSDRSTPTPTSSASPPSNSDDGTDDTSGASDGASTSDTIRYRVDTSQPLSAGTTGAATIVVAASASDSLHVPEIAIRASGGKSWLESTSDERLNVTVGLCASGSCVVSGNGVRSGLRVRLPDVYRG